MAAGSVHASPTPFIRNKTMPIILASEAKKQGCVSTFPEPYLVPEILDDLQQ